MIQRATDPIDASTPPSPPDVEPHLEALQTIAEHLAGQPEALLDLLRRIEKLHRAIQDGPFRSSLPNDRSGLFNVLSEMESSGGWPYIPRLQLRTFIDLLAPDPES
ncbi:hypothetical protein [Synechococcus sp. CCY 9618]|uniref:hypothetical protein n=1 Tax=Synechococcus sp. CCY 9618 TaxID=2815602 RepID=UPI001C22E9F8|nr:hypothetical protein [Synechococcus sp. CCY 9618]